jgi:hypothetical protein
MALYSVVHTTRNNTIVRDTVAQERTDDNLRPSYISLLGLDFRQKCVDTK